MRKGLLMIAIVALFLTSCRSKETQWVLIKDDPSLKLYVDKESVKHVSEDLVRALVTFDFKVPKGSESRPIKKALSYDEIDCAKKTLQIIQVTFYFADGTSQSLSKKLAVSGITPASPGDAEYNYLCKK